MPYIYENFNLKYGRNIFLPEGNKNGADRLNVSSTT